MAQPHSNITPPLPLTLSHLAFQAAGLPPNVVSGTIDTNYYPLSLSASQIAWAIFELALFAGTMLLSWRGLMAVTGALGAQGQQVRRGDVWLLHAYGWDADGLIGCLLTVYVMGGCVCA